MASHNGKHVFSNLLLSPCIGTEAYVGFKVRANPDNTSLDSHLEREADDSSDLQQRLFAEAPPSLRGMKSRRKHR